MFENIPIGSKAPEEFNVIIEIPQGSQNKYEYDETMQAIKLDRVLFSPFHYPTDYGFIPETRSEDGDHLDALVLASKPLFPGCVVVARPVAVFDMVDQGEKDEKILAVAADDPRFADVKALNDLPPHLPKEIAHFFEAYKALENKKVEVSGWRGRDDALRILREAQERWKQKDKS